MIEELPICICIDTTLLLDGFEIKLDTICHFRHNVESNTYSVFMVYMVIPFSKITLKYNISLYHQYNINYDKFDKHFITKAKWREHQINSILE